jgi:antitoxin VapB
VREKGDSRVADATFTLECSHFDVTAKAMPNLTLRDVPADLHLWLKQQAEAHRRSLNQEVILQLDALRGLPASRSDADLRLARMRAIAARAARLPVLDERPEAEILGLDADGLPR